jgi:hypothetical protein
VNVALDLPDAFEQVEAPANAFLALAREPDAGGFRANVGGTVERPPPGQDLEALEAASLEQHAEVLDGFRVLDREATALAGERALRVLAHHATGGRALVLEQWRLSAGDRLVTVSITCPAIDWPISAGPLEAAAESLRLGAAA